MAIGNLGSIGNNIHGQIEDIPTTLSGAQMLSIIDNQRLFMESKIGETIGSTAIAEKYQPALMSLSCAAVLNRMQLTGADVESFKLGDFSTKKGEGGNLSSAAKAFKIEGLEMLKRLGTKQEYYVTNC